MRKFGMVITLSVLLIACAGCTDSTHKGQETETLESVSESYKEPEQSKAEDTQTQETSAGDYEEGELEL